MAKDDDILRDAIIGTEKEIAASAFDREEDGPSDGDRTLESMGNGLEGQHDPEDDDDAEDPDDGADDDAHPSEEPENPDAVEAKTGKEPEPKPGETQQDPQGRVPAGRLREEAEARRAVTAERDTLKSQLDAEKAERLALNAKVDALLALQKAPATQQPTQPQKPDIPDIFEDPKAYAEYLDRRNQERFDAYDRKQHDREVNASIESARTRHGQVFQDAWKALDSLPKGAPETLDIARRLNAQPNVGEAIISWHKRNVAAREVGDDLDGYKARIAAETREALITDPEFRKELLASMRGDAMIGDQGRPRTAVRLPQSLSRTPGSNSRAPNDLEIYDGSESAIAASAWSE